MSEERPQTSSSPPEEEFHLGPGRPLLTILSILAVIGLAGLGFGALLGAEVDVVPFVPERGPDRVTGGGLGALPGAGGTIPSLLADLHQVQTSPPPSTPGSPGEASPIGDPEDQPGGRLERFGPNDEGALVVPDGWAVVARSEDLITLGTGDGVRFGARIVRATPATPATQLVTEAQARIVASSVAAHVRTSDVLPLQAFGSLVTRSTVGYSALRTDAQGVSSVGGNIFAFVRIDGLALVVTAEVTPGAHWTARTEEWLPLWESVVSIFAGAPLPA